MRQRVVDVLKEGKDIRNVEWPMKDILDVLNKQLFLTVRLAGRMLDPCADVAGGSAWRRRWRNRFIWCW